MSAETAPGRNFLDRWAQALPAMRLKSSPLKTQTLSDAFVRCCTCKDSDFWPSCSCTLATTPQRATPRSPLVELKTDTNILDLDSSPSKCRSSSFRLVRAQSKALDLESSPSKRTPTRTQSSSSVSPSNSGRSRALIRGKSGKRSYSPDSFLETKENREVDQQEQLIQDATVVSPFKRKRPPKLQIPTCSDSSSSHHNKNDDKDIPMELFVEGKSYGMYSRKGQRDVLEDTYQAVPDIDGNTQQAFFGIFDGHGGRVAAEFAADNLFCNIREALSNGEHDLEAAVKLGYLATDASFLQKQVSSGASCVTAFLREDSMVVANAGDCRAVMSRNGTAIALTEDHRLAREDERRRVENLGAYVDCFSGVWRLQGILAVSRGIGDIHLKEWVSAEPEIHRLTIDSGSEFLLLASDGLWDVVSNQEAVDCVGAEVKWTGKNMGGLAAACKKVTQLAASRGSQDDISVMLVNLRHFCKSDNH